VDAVQGIIVVLSIVGTGYIEGIQKDYFRAFVVDTGLVAFFVSAKVLRKAHPRSKIVLEYARRTYRLAQWIFPVAAASIAPSVLTLIPFLGTLGYTAQNAALVIGVLAFLVLLGTFIGLGDFFKQWEDEMVRKFESDNRLRERCV